MQSNLQSPIEYLKNVGPQRGDMLKKELEIFTFEDLLNYFPFRYVDRSVIHTIRDINPDTQFIQLQGTITSCKILGEKFSKRLIATFRDRTGTIDLIWFQGADWMLKNIVQHKEYLIFGKPTVFNGNYNISHPEIELVTGAVSTEGKGLQPVYPSTEKLKKRQLESKGILKLIKTLLDQLREQDIPEFLPADLIQEHKLLSRFESFKNIHFPKDEHLLERAKHRIKFEELFLIQLKLLKVKANRGISSRGFLLEKIDQKFDDFFKNHLPFELTNAQKKVLKEIRRDTLSGRQMNRLLQGDVGSGKTIVSLLTMLMALDNGFQAAIMAPTEILANQHSESITALVRTMNLNVALLTGNVKGKQRKNLLENLAEGKIDILIGTHALLEDKVIFKNLGMVIIDEQHRFGVAQRAKLWAKNVQPPHVLVMTATPIPRTLAMTVYGDLDISIIDELPPGRKPIKTVHRFDSNRLRVFGFMQEQIAAGRQVYVVYPLIEESEALDLKDLMDGYESISRAFPLPNYAIGIVHGRMKSADKDFEMQRFMRGETNILVATTVIEVGVNVPNASVMVIESAERFGLSQLHQLRGRVGRGADQSFCILMTKDKMGYESKKRIEVMCATNDGFRIAEEDLKLRGPGDIEGTKQSGAISLRLADIVNDGALLELARTAAFDLIERDPNLQQSKHAALLQFVTKHGTASLWARIG